MTPDRWQKITDVFHAALGHDESTREAFLDEACKHDPTLRAEVDALVVAHKEAGSFGEKPLVALPQVQSGPASMTSPNRLRRETLFGATGKVGRCSQCGTELISEAGMPALCPHCLLNLALPDSDSAVEHLLSVGRVVGDRYQILEMLGRGGMGEVFRAFDLKLRVDVGLKAIRVGQFGNDRAREIVRREVRSAREVISSNVCRIFDLVVADEEEFVSMEYIDGITLAAGLRERGPLGLQEAREIASQFLSGLEAIHRAGLVHRDFKPENIMITRAGRVVVMDFGLANIPTEGSARTIAGTPAYMAPEQARGEGVDARADVFAAGVVLAEMLSAGGEASLSSRQAVWRAVREAPPQVPDGPWAPVLRQALASSPGARFPSAHALARALEDVTFRLPGFEQMRPYPGLAPFTTDEAQFFFGREVETEKLLKKLDRPRLLALIGPSGAGKSSFLRAGLIPTFPDTWKAVMTTPGNRPFQSLAQALAPSFAGDTEAIQQLLRFDEEDTAVLLLTRLRQRCDRSVLIVDQFEELFTLCSLDVQAAFARLLGRLVLETDLRVILSLRDDFLLRCQAHESLAPAFADVTPLGALSESALRRALVQPALACGYRFEDESLVDDMIREVREERGALPLLAFAASRLWERRNRERGLLTREAYREIGGVAGALAQHAEATLERIGSNQIPLVRELFRNLVTSLGTRAVREREELLSVFDGALASVGNRAQAEQVLSALVDARLLNSYAPAGEDGEKSRHQVEIVHESLLAAWPRLVRWRTQDAEGAQVRDQLRQAAQLWQDRGRPDDLLWSGTSYRDFVIWRERYPGALSATESSFAKAAKQRVSRLRRRTQVAIASLVVAASVVAVTTTIMWQRSEGMRRTAESETLRAEAGKLLVMGERELDRYPTAALAYAMKSLELADTESGRHLALRILQRGPVARLARVSEGYGSGNVAGTIAFSPTGEWLAWGGIEKAEVLHRDGEKRIVLGDYRAAGGQSVQVQFGRSNDTLVTNLSGDVRVWSMPEGRELGRGQVDNGAPSILSTGIDTFLTLTAVGERELVRSWPLPTGEPRLIGSMQVPQRLTATSRNLAYTQGRAIYLRSLEHWNLPPRLIAKPQTDVFYLALSPDAAQAATGDQTTRVQIWQTGTPSSQPKRVLQAPGTVVGLYYDPTGRWLSALDFERGFPRFALFDLSSPAGSDPLLVQKGDTNSASEVAFDASGRWFATAHGLEVALWPLGGPKNHVFRAEWSFPSIVFAPDGQHLFSLSVDRGVRSWSLRDPDQLPVQLLPAESPPSPVRLFAALDASGQRLALSGGGGRVTVVSIHDGSTRNLKGFPSRTLVGKPAFSEDGRLLAAGLFGGPAAEKAVRVWDLEKHTVRAFHLPGAGDRSVGGTAAVHFAGRDRLLASVLGIGIVAIDLVSGESRVLVPQSVGDAVVSRNGRFGVGAALNQQGLAELSRSPLMRFDLESGTAMPLSSHGKAVTAVALDPSDSLVASGSFDGTIRIGPASGEEPHLLLGQEGEGAIYSLSFSPDGRWIAASGEGFAIHLWPVPDVSKQPVHRRPFADLLALLRSHTNLRTVPDPGSSTGYRLEIGPFPGWARLPEW